MILLDVSLPPSAPWWAALIALGIPGVGAAINAWIQYRQKKPAMPELAPIVERVTAAEEKIVAIAGTDRADVAQLKEDVGAIGVDLGRLRDEVKKRWDADDARRGRAGKYAEEERKELRRDIAAISERVAGMAGRIEGMVTPRGR